MVYFENAFRWFFFHHNLKMHGPSCKIPTSVFPYTAMFQFQFATYGYNLKGCHSYTILALDKKMRAQHT
jgi:hypothetical protein